MNEYIAFKAICCWVELEAEDRLRAVVLNWAIKIGFVLAFVFTMSCSQVHPSLSLPRPYNSVRRLPFSASQSMILKPQVPPPLASTLPSKDQARL